MPICNSPDNQRFLRQALDRALPGYHYPQVAVGFARSAEARGATLLPHTAVTRVLIENGQVTGIATTKGTIRAPIVVDAAGAWTRQVAEASGIRIPLLPTAQ